MATMKESTKNVFSLAVEKKAIEEGVDYLDALQSVMEECVIEPTYVARMINNSLKTKLEAEAREKRLLKGQAEPTLPV